MIGKANKLLPSGQDGVLWKAKALYDKMAPISQRSDAIKSIARTIALYDDAFVRDNYTELVSKQIGVKPKDIRQYLSAVAEAVEDEEQPGGDALSNIIRTWKLDEEQQTTLKNWMFWQQSDPKKKNKFGYYVVQPNWQIKQVANFIITPLYHIKVKRNERRMLSIDNGYESKTVELDVTQTTGGDAFRKEVNRYGGFWWKGSTEHLITIFQAMGHQAFPACFEIQTLGWHPRGFWSFSNAAYNGKLEPYNEFGMYEHGGTWYNVPFLSPIDKDYEDNEESFEFQHYLKYNQSPIKFTEWSTLICQAYLHMGPLAIAYSIATLFRDVVLQSTKLPFLYNYGAVNAGKSDFSESISNLFFSGRGPDGDMYKPFNLAHGTDFAFMERMGRFSNCPNILNEFDEIKIDEGWFRSIKGAYDGEGREKGDIARAGKTKVQRIRCSIILNGQYLGSKDDNSVVSRSLLNHFKAIQAGERPQAQVDAFTKLKNLETKGISSIITELLDHRKHFASTFPTEFKTNQDYLLEKALEKGTKPQVRLVKNWAAMLASYTTIQQKYKLPVTDDEFAIYCLNQVLASTAIISTTNTLAEFWMVFQNLIETRQIVAGLHWALQPEMKLQLDDQQPINFTKQSKNCLYLRVNTIYPFYARTSKQIGTSVFSPKNLENYLRESPYFLGTIRSRRFSGVDNLGNQESTTTSCYVFDFDHPAIDQLGMSFHATGKAQIEAEFNEPLAASTTDNLPF